MACVNGCGQLKAHCLVPRFHTLPHASTCFHALAHANCIIVTKRIRIITTVTGCTDYRLSFSQGRIVSVDALRKDRTSRLPDLTRIFERFSITSPHNSAAYSL